MSALTRKGNNKVAPSTQARLAPSPSFKTGQPNVVIFKSVLEAVAEHHRLKFLAFLLAYCVIFFAAIVLFSNKESSINRTEVLENFLRDNNDLFVECKSKHECGQMEVNGVNAWREQNFTVGDFHKAEAIILAVSRLLLPDVADDCLNERPQSSKCLMSPEDLKSHRADRSSQPRSFGPAHDPHRYVYRWLDFGFSASAWSVRDPLYIAGLTSLDDFDKKWAELVESGYLLHSGFQTWLQVLVHNAETDNRFWVITAANTDLETGSLHAINTRGGTALIPAQRLTYFDGKGINVLRFLLDLCVLFGTIAYAVTEIQDIAATIQQNRIIKDSTSRIQHSGWRAVWSGIKVHFSITWNVLEALAILFMLLDLGFYFTIILPDEWRLNGDYLPNNMHDFFDWYKSYLLYSIKYMTVTYIAAICFVLQAARLFKNVRFFAGLRVYTQIISNSWKFLRDFIIYFGFLLAIIAGFLFLLFSTSGGNRLFATFSSSIKSVSLLTFTFVDYAEVANFFQGVSTFGPLIDLAFFLLVVLLVILAQNVILAIVVDSYEEAKQRNSLDGTADSFLSSVIRRVKGTSIYLLHMVGLLRHFPQHKWEPAIRRHKLLSSSFGKSLLMLFESASTGEISYELFNSTRDKKVGEDLPCNWLWQADRPWHFGERQYDTLRQSALEDLTNILEDLDAVWQRVETNPKVNETESELVGVGAVEVNPAHHLWDARYVPPELYPPEETASAKALAALLISIFGREARAETEMQHLSDQERIVQLQQHINLLDEKIDAKFDMLMEMIAQRLPAAGSPSVMHGDPVA